MVPPVYGPSVRAVAVAGQSTLARTTKNLSTKMLRCILQADVAPTAPEPKPYLIPQITTSSSKPITHVYHVLLPSHKPKRPPGCAFNRQRYSPFIQSRRSGKHVRPQPPRPFTKQNTNVAQERSK